MLINDLQMITDEYKSLKDRLNYNYVLFDIYEGSLLKYVLEDIRKQVSEKTFASIEPRVVPINFLKKIVDKLSQIYADEPNRILLKQDDSDQKLFEFYSGMLQVDTEMGLANEIFNLEKYVMIEPYLDGDVPALRIVQPDKFFVMSTNKANPTRVTHYIKIMGKTKDADILHVFTDDEFLIIDSNGKVLQDSMDAIGNSGINPIGRIPAVYIAKSKFDLIPREDTDLLKMTKIMPILFSDLNEVIFWQSFSIIYGIDLNDENLTMAPNAFWSLKSDPATAQKPEVGTIKPQADIESVMNFIMFQLNTWLNTRGIKSGTASANTTEISGFSKMVDEIDTTEDRKKQIPYFKKAEYQLWDLIMNFMHPYWVKNKMISINQMFTPNQKVITEFKKQIPIVNTKETLAEVKEELNSRLTTRRRAIAKINPKMSADEIENLIKEIDEENTVYVDENENQDKPTL